MQEIKGKPRKTTLMYFIRPYLGWYLIGWVFLILSSSAGLIFPYLMGKLLGSTTSMSTTSSESIGLLTMDNATDVAFALFVLFAFQALFSFVRVVIFNNVTERIHFVIFEIMLLKKWSLCLWLFSIPTRWESLQVEFLQI